MNISPGKIFLGINLENVVNGWESASVGYILN